jgi:hypothetical protein
LAVVEIDEYAAHRNRQLSLSAARPCFTNDGTPALFPLLFGGENDGTE